MEHSIEEYLARQTTEELEVLLDSYLNDKSELYQYYVELIKMILEGRKADRQSIWQLGRVYFA